MFLSLKCSNASGDGVGVMSVAKSRELEGISRGHINMNEMNLEGSRAMT